MNPAVASICASLITLLAFPAASQVHSEDTVAEERLIARCIHQSARGERWLEEVLQGIRDQEGGWIGAQVRNRDGSHDLGPMQINSWWVQRFALIFDQPQWTIRRWLLHDACFNVEAARWLLLHELSRTRDLWTAIGKYHSPDQDKGRRYLTEFAWKFTRRKESSRRWFHMLSKYRLQYGGKHTICVDRCLAPPVPRNRQGGGSVAR